MPVKPPTGVFPIKSFFTGFILGVITLAITIAGLIPVYDQWLNQKPSTTTPNAARNPSNFVVPEATKNITEPRSTASFVSSSAKIEASKKMRTNSQNDSIGYIEEEDCNTDVETNSEIEETEETIDSSTDCVCDTTTIEAPETTDSTTTEPDTEEEVEDEPS